jgi:uncharacterized protein with HEPN domain
MNRDPRAALEDIVESMDRILEHTKSVSEQGFFASILIQDAVLRRLAIIGEAAKRVPPEIRDAHSDIPWKQIAGTRDILIHDYSNVGR